jgi:hypothetical protein
MGVPSDKSHGNSSAQLKGIHSGQRETGMVGLYWILRPFIADKDRLLIIRKRPRSCQLYYLASASYGHHNAKRLKKGRVRLGSETLSRFN